MIHLVSAEEFWGYVENNRRVEEHGITVVPEDNDLMTGSYVMVDPAGRFFDNAAGAHTYSRPILEVGVEPGPDGRVRGRGKIPVQERNVCLVTASLARRAHPAGER